LEQAVARLLRGLKSTAIVVVLTAVVPFMLVIVPMVIGIVVTLVRRHHTS
jgi:hypothetical protein